jgi:galactonate dehydratase
VKVTRLTTCHAVPRWLFLGMEAGEGIRSRSEPVIAGRSHTVEAAVQELSEHVH